MNREEVQNVLVWLGSHEHIDKLKEIWWDIDQDIRMDVLRDCWSGEQHPYRHRDFFDCVLPKKPFTDNPEALESLPDVLTLYRGGEKGIAGQGYSWTLDKKIAQKFAERQNTPTGSRTLKRETPGDLVEMVIKKSQISFFIAGRQESEVVVRREHWPAT